MMQTVPTMKSWRPLAGSRLGFEFEDIADWGLDIWKSQEEKKAAEDIKDAAEARERAARAAAEAATKTAEAEASKADQGKILGIPTEYLILGGVVLGIGAIAVVLLK